LQNDHEFKFKPGEFYPALMKTKGLYLEVNDVNLYLIL
jgi:hypothetical protein